MEELLAYALLSCSGFDGGEARFWTRLNQLFLANPDSRLLLELECETNLYRALAVLRTHMETEGLDRARFGRELMRLLRTHYTVCTDLPEFGRRAHSLWNGLPGSLQCTDPFEALLWACDLLSLEGEAQCRDFCERMFRFYDHEH